MTPTLSLITATIALTIASPLFAIGSGSSAPPKPTETTQSCHKNKVWDANKGKCVKIKDSQLDDDSIYENARELAYAGRYDDALTLLNRADNPQDPRILNYKAFTNRKMGHPKKATAFYEQALAIDPKYILARSYYGQAKLQSGDVTGAKEQLALIKSIKGTDNWAYESLSNVIHGRAGSDY